jgi:hypothetical protein
VFERRAVEVSSTLPSTMKRHFHMRFSRQIARVLDGREGARSRGDRSPDVWELKRGWIAGCAVLVEATVCCARFAGTFQFILKVVNLCDTKRWLHPFLACICALPRIKKFRREARGDENLRILI